MRAHSILSRFDGNDCEIIAGVILTHLNFFDIEKRILLAIHNASAERDLGTFSKC